MPDPCDPPGFRDNRPVNRRLALLLLLPALGACPADPQVHLEKARELTFQRQPEAALREYDEVLSLLAKKDHRRVRDVLIPSLKGAGDLCYLELRQPERAIEYYRTLARRFPEALETLDARANLADLYRAQNDRRSSVAELAAIVLTFQDHPEVDRFQYLAAKDYFELGDYDQVAIEAKVLQSKYPNSTWADDVQLLIAAALAMQGQREKAIEAYQEVEKRWPGSEMVPRAHYEEAKVLAEMEKEEEALELLVKALATHPDPKGVQLELARLRTRLAQRRLPAHPAESAFAPPRVASP